MNHPDNGWPGQRLGKRMLKTPPNYLRLIYIGFISSLLAFGLYGLFQGLVLLVFSEFFPAARFLPNLLLFLAYGGIAGFAAGGIAGLLKISGPGRFIPDQAWFKILFFTYLAGNILLHTFIGLYKNFNRVSLTAQMLARLMNPSTGVFLLLTVLFFILLFRFLRRRQTWSDRYILIISQYAFFSAILTLALLNERIFKVLIKFRGLTCLKGVAIYLVVLAAGAALSYIAVSRLYHYWRKLGAAASWARPGLIIAAALIFILWFLFQGAQERTGSSRMDPVLKSRPNILFIVIDTLRADRLGCYGYHRQTSPHIDEIAGQGALFKKVVAPGAWTLPTHASMFSGMYPSRHGAHLEDFNLDDDITTLAEYFAGRGYYTAGFCHNGWISHTNGFAQGFQSYFQMWKTLSIRYSAVELLRQIYFRNRYSDDSDLLAVMNNDAAITNRFILEWIRKNYTQKHPLFLFINYMDVHGPYKPPRTISYPFLDEELLERSFNFHPAHFHFNYEKYDRTAKETLSRLYDGGIHYLDYQLSRLFRELSSQMSLDDTVIIITSDHGESLGENRMIGHDMSLYNTVTSVPLIIRYPERFRPGTVITTPVQTVDIFPTLVDLIQPEDLKTLPEIQGRSLLRLEEKASPPFLISEYFLPGFWFGSWKKAVPEIDSARIEAFNRRIKSIEQGDYKFIWYSDGASELYQVKDDPYEENNLIDREPNIAAELNARLQEWLRSFEHREPAGEGKEPAMDEETRENLRALGYLS